MADRMPNENKMHLSSCMMKSRVYKVYVEEITKNDMPEKPLGYSQFRNMWNKKFKHVIIPKEYNQQRTDVDNLVAEKNALSESFASSYADDFDQDEPSPFKVVEDYGLEKKRRKNMQEKAHHPTTKVRYADMNVPLTIN
ncbi:uncharacterized protein LOC144652321 [Oculina patagonica]